ncbi:hypothetical protein VZT92_021970 [Zoarces viviparus]|uniref:Uncharacterized protein n=1 Tax=Zoarces viviparus TaxID=48416 RepID=A0AAW1E9H8_ZOAVI
MLNILKCFDAQAASTCINPYAVDVIRGQEEGSSLRDLAHRGSTGSSGRGGAHDGSEEIRRLDHQDSHGSKLQGPGPPGGQR